MVVCAISHKTNPGDAWPLWRNIYYFQTDDPINPGTAKAWANEIAWIEKPLYMAGVVLGLISFHTCDGSGDPEAPAAMAYDGSHFEGMVVRTSNAPIAYEFGLRLAAGHPTGRASGYMLRGCLGEADIIRGERNAVALSNRSGMNAFLQYNRSRTTNLVFSHLCTMNGPGCWPVIATTPVQSLVVGGVTKLNANRKAMARHLQSDVAIYQKIYGLVWAYILLWTPVYEEWYLTTGFPYNPAGLRDPVLAMVGIAKAIPDAILDWLQDEDPDTDGDQVPEARYLMTRGSLSGICTKLQTAAELATDSVTQFSTYTADGNEYFTEKDFHDMFDIVNNMLGSVVQCLAFDYQRADQVTPQSKVRGGYILRHPELGPFDG